MLKNLTELNFIFDRRIDTLVFVDLDGLKKGTHVIYALGIDCAVNFT